MVLPLLQDEVVGPGWMDKERFLAGYGVAQVLPGPLFSVAAYLGTSLPASSPLAAVGTGLLALVAIFMPGLLIALGSVRLFHGLRTMPRARRLVAGLNAGVVGLLIAVCYGPVFTSAIHARSDLAFALLDFVALVVLRWPSIVVVVGCTLVVYGWLRVMQASWDSGRVMIGDQRSGGSVRSAGAGLRPTKPK